MSTWNPELDVQLTESEDEEDIAMKRDFRGREALLFVVDANLMEQPGHLLQALQIIRSAFISGILVNDKDLMGLMFANTKHSPLPYEISCLDNIVVPANSAVFLPPRQLTTDIVKHYLEFLASVNNCFETDFGIAENGGCGNFATMLRLAIELLEKCGHKLNNAKIIYMTNRATPHPPQTFEYQMALQKAIDLDGKEIEFRVIPMINDFDYNVFYREFICLSRAIEPDSFQVPDAELEREILEDRKLKQDFLRRCLGHFNFTLGPNLSLSVQYYSYFQHRSYPKKVQILRKNNAVVHKQNRLMVRKIDSATDEILHEHQVKMTDGWHEINLGAMVMRITTEQLNRVRNLHQPGMMLLGFKHRSALPEIFYSKPSNFMYPDDQHIIGSKRLFRALWQRCLEREKIAICLFMCKRKSMPRYVALVPVEAIHADCSDTQGQKNYRSLLSGDGFKIVYLPAAKHIRHPDLGDWNAIGNTATDEGVKLFQKVIKKLRIDYQPSLINDPNLDSLQANLLALALDENINNDDDQCVMPNVDEQDKRIAQFLPEYEQIFGTDTELAPKRSAARNATDGASASKMQRIDDDAIKTYDFVEQLIKEKRLHSCTVAQLRYILSEHFNIKVAKSATKATLLARIEDENIDA